MKNQFDIIIIGTGMGGGTLSYALRDSGARILLIERGDYLPREPENWLPKAVFDQERYKPKERWHGPKGITFKPGVHYFVGGNTKVYGAALPRLRREDFEVLEHEGGSSPAWPISYDTLKPYYAQAEKIYQVHGQVGDDPTEPERNESYPFPPVSHEPYIEKLAEKLNQQGLHPFHYPMGIDLQPDGKCIRCKTCDGFPCQLMAKSDAEACCLEPALESQDITLWTRTYARRLLTDTSSQRVTSVEIEQDGELKEVSAGTIIVSAGAVNSTAMLLRSANSQYPNGLANTSNLVGRNYMVHNNTALMAVNPFERNQTVFQKTMGVNDFYFKGPDFPYPMGNIQLLGKLQAGMLTAAQPLVPRPILQAIANRSVDWWVMSEDLPDLENHITLKSNGDIQVNWRPNNLVAHWKLVDAARKMMKRAGYPLVFIEQLGIETNSHQCGTMRFGTDPATSVLNPFCQTHDINNLYVVDSSFFPSSGAMNPGLTIAAQALRVADHIMN